MTTERPIRIKVGFPQIISVETDDVLSLFRRRRASRGPFLVIVRGKGLALDVGLRKVEGESPVLWPTQAMPQQLWYFDGTDRPDEFLVISLHSGLALDAGTGWETPRQALLGSRGGQSHQRWRLIPTDDGAANFLQSARTGHVLEAPCEAERETRTHPVLQEMHGGENQQFVIATPSQG